VGHSITKVRGLSGVRDNAINECHHQIVKTITCGECINSPTLAWLFIVCVSTSFWSRTLQVCVCSPLPL